MTVTCSCREKGMYHLVADEGYHLMIPPSGYIYTDLVCHESQIGRWKEVKNKPMKVEPLGENYVVLMADEGSTLKQKNIGWQNRDTFIVNKSAIGWYEEIPKTVQGKNGQLLFGFMTD